MDTKGTQTVREGAFDLKIDDTQMHVEWHQDLDAQAFSVKTSGHTGSGNTWNVSADITGPIAVDFGNTVMHETDALKPSLLVEMAKLFASKAADAFSDTGAVGGTEAPATSATATPASPVTPVPGTATVSSSPVASSPVAAPSAIAAPAIAPLPVCSAQAPVEAAPTSSVPTTTPAPTAPAGPTAADASIAPGLAPTTTNPVAGG